MNPAAEFSRNLPADALLLQSAQAAQTAQTAHNAARGGVQQEVLVQSQQHQQYQQHQQQQQQHQQQQQQHQQHQQQQQQRSSSQAERTGRDAVVSATTTATTAGAAGRVEAPVGTGSYQQFSAEGENVLGTSNGSLGSTASSERRQGRFRRQVIRLPDQPSGQVRQVHRRLPTPEPDTLERVYMQRTGAEIVEEITEVPTTPPPRVQERTVVEPAGPPQVVKRTVRVPPRGNYGGHQQPQGTGYQPASFPGAEAHSGIQQAASGYPPQAGGAYPGGYGGAPISSFNSGFSSASSGYGAVGGAGFPQPTGPVTGAVSFVVDSRTSQVLPPAGCQPAFCFYV